MYEQIRSDIMSSLSDNFNPCDIAIIIKSLDNIFCNYDITKKSVDIIPYGYNFMQTVKVYIVSRSIEGLSITTAKMYTSILKKFSNDIHKNIEEITSNDIRVWLYKQEQCVKKRTAELYRLILSGFFKWATQEQRIQHNPMQKLKHIKYEKKKRTPLNQFQLQYIRNACETIRDKAMIETLYSTGCRVSELTNIRKEDINWHSSQMLVLGKGNKYRTVYLNAKANIALKTYLNSRTDDSDFVFVSYRAPHNKMTKSGVERVVKLISQKAGVKITPHVIRHTTATVAVQNGMPIQDIQKLLGHANINTTMIYADIPQEDVKNMHKKCLI